MAADEATKVAPYSLQSSFSKNMRQFGGILGETQCIPNFSLKFYSRLQQAMNHPGQVLSLDFKNELTVYCSGYANAISYFMAAIGFLTKENATMEDYIKGVGFALCGFFATFVPRSNSPMNVSTPLFVFTSAIDLVASLIDLWNADKKLTFYNTQASLMGPFDPLERQKLEEALSAAKWEVGYKTLTMIASILFICSNPLAQFIAFFVAAPVILVYLHRNVIKPGYELLSQAGFFSCCNGRKDVTAIDVNGHTNGHTMNHSHGTNGYHVVDDHPEGATVRLT